MKHAFFIILILGSSLAFSRTKGSRLTYDVSGSQSTLNDRTYQEINLGVNWFFSDWLIWRNSGFHRQAEDQDSVYGLDTSLRLQKEWINQGRTLGFKIFAGPGARFASERHNAHFGEAGLGFRLGGIQIGGGIKAIRYTHSREDKEGRPLPRDENQVFVTLSGGGTL